MTVGDINVTWTPVLEALQWVQYTGAYTVSVASVSLRGSQVQAALGSFIVDSGTTFTYFTSVQATALREAVRVACGGGACGGATLATARCWEAEPGAVDAFPPLEFQLGSSGELVTYQWAPKGYLYEAHAGRWCYAFSGDPPLTLGASFLQHHLIVFDRSNKSLGFARAECPTITSRSDNGDAGLRIDANASRANLRGMSVGGIEDVLGMHHESTSPSRAGARFSISTLAVFLMFFARIV